MQIDWDVASRIAAPLIALVAGAFLNRLFERKPKILYFLNYLDTVKLKSVKEPPEMAINSHSVTVRNVGRRTATGVRIGHRQLPPDFSVYPSVDYGVTELPDGGAEIVLKKLVPGEEVKLSYAYLPPLTAGGIVNTVKHDDGFATVVDMVPVQKTPKWLQRILLFLAFVGFITLIYLLILFFRSVIA